MEQHGNKNRRKKEKKSVWHEKTPHPWGLQHIQQRKHCFIGGDRKQAERKQLPVEGFYGLMGPHWEEQLLNSSVLKSNIFPYFHFGVVSKSLLFCVTKNTNGFIIIFRSCLTTCLLIILILMVTHCCFGCGSLQLQSVKSSGGMRHSLC